VMDSSRWYRMTERLIWDLCRQGEASSLSSRGRSRRQGSVR